jgi:hypothetical protein
MEADFDKINESAEKLRASAERLQKFHSTKKRTRSGKLSKRDAAQLERLESKFTEANLAVRQILPAAVTTAAPPEPAIFDFDEFFEKVADGFIKAQQNLDAASAQYLAAVSKQPHALPSVFRIPRVAADVKFALEKTAGKKIQLLFFKNENVATTLNQQTVQFEIVAAPPPAGLLIGPVTAFPVLSKSRRAELFKLIQDYLLPSPNNTPALTDQLLDRARLAKDPNSVIVISVDGDRRFLLAYAGDGASGNVGLWYLDLETQPVSFAVIRKFGSPNDPNIESVRAFLFKLGMQQKEFLAKLP